jgi:hypothetical protein
MNSVAELKVTSHVARDLLQSAALFQHEHQVVWEYVSNGLEYVDPGIRPTVDVSIDARAKRIVISDNGRGMTSQDLGRYFQMHAENVDRKKGKPGRGMFGTGKSAAFGIGDRLVLSTVHNGLRCKVRLDRADIKAAEDGTSIPVKVLESDVPTREPNGTVVEVEGIHLKKIDIGSVTRHIERHIQHWPNATVIVNRQECKVEEPSYGDVRKFSTRGTPFEASLGPIELTIKIARAPLEQEWQGIAILSNNVWHTTTLAGCEGKLFANYIFGELDVPRIAEDKSAISPFDMSRSMKLNPKNETVAQVFAFVGSHIEIVRRELERSDKERKKDRDAKRLAEEASAIAKIINQDFDSWRHKVQRTLAKVPGGTDKLGGGAPQGGESGEELAPGPDVPAILVDGGGGTGEGSGGGGGGGGGGQGGKKLERTDGEGETTGTPRQPKPTASGGFNVDFRNMGVESARAAYKRDERTIYINLDHLQIAAAQALGGVEDIAFRRLSYEVAFSEYAIALASELAGGDYYRDPTDPIVDIRETLNRISIAAASLYAKT